MLQSIAVEHTDLAIMDNTKVEKLDKNVQLVMSNHIELVTTKYDGSFHTMKRIGLVQDLLEFYNL